MTDIQECREELLNAFPGSFINDKDEFIAHQRTNQYVILSDCKTPQDIESMDAVAGTIQTGN